MPQRQDLPSQSTTVSGINRWHHCQRPKSVGSSVASAIRGLLGSHPQQEQILFRRVFLTLALQPNPLRQQAHHDADPPWRVLPEKSGSRRR